MGYGTAYPRHLDRICLGVVLNHICVWGSMCVCVCDYTTLNALPSNIKYTGRGTALAMIYILVENFLNWAERYNVCYISSTIEMPFHNINISLKVFPLLPLGVHKWHTLWLDTCACFSVEYGMVWFDAYIVYIYIYINIFLVANSTSGIDKLSPCLNSNHLTNKD